MAEIGKLRYHPNYRIGTEKYNEYLTDLFTGFYYDRMVPFEDDLEKEAAHGERLWRSETEATPEELLCTAVIGRAVVDLMELYCSGGRPARREMERSHASIRSLRMDQNIREIVRFLEMYDEDRVVLNTVEDLLRRYRDPEWVVDVVKRSYSRWLARIGKKQRTEGKA